MYYKRKLFPVKDWTITAIKERAEKIMKGKYPEHEIFLTINRYDKDTWLAEITNSTTRLGLFNKRVNF